MSLSMNRRLEIGLLLALCIFLPLYEAPKNLAWLAYALVWSANRVRERDFGGRWDLWDTLILAWLASGFIIAPFAAFRGGQPVGRGCRAAYARHPGARVVAPLALSSRARRGGTRRLWRPGRARRR